MDKYVGTIIKLVNVCNGSEVYGYLEEFDKDSNRVKLNKAIMNINRMYADPSGTMQEIIKYDYDSRNGNTITTPASTVYTNTNDGKHITFVDLSGFLFIPLYDSSYNSEKKVDKVKEIVQIKETFENYIEHIYSTFSDVLFGINQNLTTDGKTSDNEVNEKE